MSDSKIIDVEIVTPQQVIYTGQGVSVTLPGSQSPFQVLNNHAPIVSALDPGLFKVVDESQKTIWFATSPGFT